MLLRYLREKFGKEVMTDFQSVVLDRFDHETLEQVSTTFKKLNLPEPEDETEYLVGCEGILVFLNDHAVTLKIERNKSDFNGERISHGGILQPIFQETTSKAMIEIYPGINLESIDDFDVGDLIKHLNKEGIRIIDPNIRNTGRLPILGVEFPEGEAVVLDRLSVRALETAAELKGQFKENFYEDKSQSQTGQFKLYKPLYEAFKKVALSTDNTSKAADKAWQLCADFKENKKLITGWLSDDVIVKNNHPMGSPLWVGIKEASVNYTNRLKGIKR